MTNYNGWKNWETWNIQLWLANEEPLYRRYVSWLGRKAIAPTDEQAKEFALSIFPGGITPDFEAMQGNPDRIDWGEIGDSFRDDWFEHQE